MSNTVDIQWNSDSTQLVRTLQSIQQGFDKLDSRMDRVEKSSRRTANVTRSLGESAQGAIGHVASLATAYLSITQAINFAKEANRQFRSEAEAAGKKSDAAFREFGILTGLRGAEFEAARARIRSHAEAIPLSDDPTDFAARAATQLASSGFSNEEASGAALRAFLEVLLASGEQDNPEEMARALSQYFAANQLDKTAANVRRVGRGIQRLSLVSDTGIGDLGALAKESSSFAEQLSFEEQAATFMTLRAAMPGEAAATAMRNIVGRLSTASASGGKVDALAALGLSPEQVDFVGEDVLTVLERLKSGLDGIREEERAPILKKLFEEQGVASTQILLRNIETIRKTIKEVGDDSAFAETVKFAGSGRVMAERRQLVRRETRRSRADDIDDLLIDSINEVLEQQGQGPIGAAAREKVHDHLRSFGLSRDSSLRAMLPLIPGFDVLTEAKLKLAEDAGHDPEIVNKLFSGAEQRRLRAGFQLPLRGQPTLEGVNQFRRDAGLAPFTQEEYDRERATPRVPIDPNLRGRMLRGLNDPPPDGQTAGAETALMQRNNQLLEQLVQNTRPTTTGPVKAHRNKPPSSRLSRGGGGVVIS